MISRDAKERLESPWFLSIDGGGGGEDVHVD